MLHEPTIEKLRAMTADAMAAAWVEQSARPIDADAANPAVDHENVGGTRRCY